MKGTRRAWLLTLGIALVIPVGSTLLSVVLLGIRDNIIPALLMVLEWPQALFTLTGMNNMWVRLGMAVVGANLIIGAFSTRK